MVTGGNVVTGYHVTWRMDSWAAIVRTATEYSIPTAESQGWRIRPWHIRPKGKGKGKGNGPGKGKGAGV